MSSLKTVPGGVEVDMRAECHGCQRYHDIRCHPDQMIAQMSSWEYKHAGPNCDVTYTKQRHRIARDVALLFSNMFNPQDAPPWFLNTNEYKENVNFQLAFNASSNLTFTSINSLASDTNLLAGASSAVVDNGASGTLLDLGLTGLVKAGSSTLTASREIDLYVWSKIDDSTYPDTITGSDATITITSTNVLNAGLVLAKSVTPDTTTNRIYPIASMSLAALFGSFLPRYWGVWVVQNTAVALASSGHQITQKQSYVVG